MNSRRTDKLEWTPLYEQLKARLVAHIRERDLWGKQLGSENDLAEHFGVSRGTVRKALKALKRDGVLASHQGRRTLVRPREPNHQQVEHVAIVGGTAWQSPMYYTHIISGITEASQDFNVVLSSVVLNRPDALRQLIDQLDQAAFAGLLLVGIGQKGPIEEIVWRSQCPAVLIDHYFDDLPVTGVIDDGEGGIKAAVEHLLDLGHRRIAYIDASRPGMNPWKRKGYVGALRAAGLSLDPGLIVASHDERSDGLGQIEELLDSPDPPTAFVTNDRIRADQVCDVARGVGLEPGRDFALVTYGHRTGAGEAGLGLTSVTFDVCALGREGLRHLRALMFGEEEAGQLFKVPSILTVGESSCRAEDLPTGRRVTGLTG